MLALLHAWLLFPAALALAGYGLGLLVEEASGRRMAGALVIPTGLAAVIVLGGITSWTAAAPVVVPLVAVLAVVGLVRHGRSRRVDPWACSAAVGVLLVFGAPVLLSGEATFAGFHVLDDTATWLGITDQVMSHGRSLSSLPASTYALVLEANIGRGYPLGSFLLLGVGRALVDMDAAWVFQPYLAVCAAMVALCGYALLAPIIASPRMRALAGFVAAQSALLYGYGQWGGIKELTLAFLLVLTVATAVDALKSRDVRPRGGLPLALTAGALTDVLGPGGAVYVIPLLGLVAGVWLWRSRVAGTLRLGLIRVATLAGLTLVFALPILLIASEALSYDTQFTGAHPTRQALLGTLLHPLSAFQLGGIWPVHDFRLTPATVPTVLLLIVVAAAAVGALVWSYRRRRPGVALYVGLAVFACAAGYLAGATPWVVAKTLAISSPAIPLAAMMGAILLWGRSRVAGAVVIAVITGGVLWSNVLAYRAVTLAPRPRLAELQHIGGLVAGKGPTFLNEYEVYADEHFLRSGAPVGPADYRKAPLPLKSGVELTDRTEAAWADLDSFPLSTLEPYRSIVTRRSPAESRPPSIYRLIWQGRYYQLWQRPAHPVRRILEHVPLGESNTLAYCGSAVGSEQPLCSVDPVATPSCKQVQGIAAQALREHAQLVAYQRPEPLVARADEGHAPGSWTDDAAAHILIPTSPGKAVLQFSQPTAEAYELWLDGQFSRGFEVSLDGRHLGTVKDQLSGFISWVRVGNVFLAARSHTFTLTYPHANLTPGSAESSLTLLSAIGLQPKRPPSELIEVAPAQAARLCGRPLDWIEVVTAA